MCCNLKRIRNYEWTSRTARSKRLLRVLRLPLWSRRSHFQSPQIFHCFHKDCRHTRLQLQSPQKLSPRLPLTRECSEPVDLALCGLRILPSQRKGDLLDLFYLLVIRCADCSFEVGKSEFVVLWCDISEVLRNF